MSSRLVLSLVACLASTGFADSRIYPAAAGEPRSLYSVTVDGQSSPTYEAKVSLGDDALRARVVDDFAHHGDEHDLAGFTSFDVSDHADVVVTCPKAVTSAKILPTSANIVPAIDGDIVRFTAIEGQQLTLEVDGDIVHSLHLFANPIEADAPKADDPNVIYLAAGVHETADGIDVPDGKTLYLAAGATLRGRGDSQGPLVRLHGKNVALRGRGVIDGGACATHSRNLVFVENAAHVLIEGVTLLDAPTWNLPIRTSDDVRVENVKIIGFRANSDGIDICNSRDVVVDGCFARTCDDLVVVKTEKNRGPVANVRVRRCVLWNAFAHALSIGAELAEPVSNVTFEDCDVIHDTGREWTLRVFQCDNAMIRDVHFRDIRVEESRRLASLWIGKFVWSRAADRGHVADVTFERIAATGKPLTIELSGFDADHLVERTAFDGITLNGRAMTSRDVIANEFAHDVRVAP